MKTNTYVTKISDTKKVTQGITKKQINAELLIGAYPALYIESSQSVSVNNSTIIVDGQAETISGKTVIEVVEMLREVGVDAYLTRRSVGMMPAELLIDFQNKIVISENIDVSPKDLNEIQNSNLMNVPGLEESAISREVISLYSKSRNIKYTKNNTEFSFFIEGDMLFTNGLLEDTTAILSYDVDKFFIFMKDENIIEINSLLKHKDLNINNKIMLNNINSKNWDKI